MKDTHPKIEQLQIEMMRQAPVWKKAHMVGQMFLTMKELSLAGLRSRHPKADEKELQRRLADIIVGEELAEKAYGPVWYEK